MATITKGKTFTNGETVTPQKLHELVDLGTVSGIVNADISASAAIADTKLAQITTAGKVANTATTATSANTANAIVVRDAGGSFTAGTITAALSGNAATATTAAACSGNAATATTLQTARTINGVSFNGSGNITVTAAPNAHTHAISDTSGLQTALDGKQASGSYAPATGIAPSAITGTAVITTDSRLSDARTPTTHTHDERYYTETEMNTLLAGKQASGNYAPATGIAPSAISGTAVVTSDSRLIPTGAIMPFAFNAFAGIPDGWAECNGFAVSRSTYNALYNVIATTYGAGDGSTTFNLPDLRGYFIRGSGTNVDGTTSGGFGLKQNDDVKPHTHPFSLSIQSLVLSVLAAFGTRSTGGSQAVSDVNVATGSPSASGSISLNSGTETRPKNIAMMYCIKF